MKTKTTTVLSICLALTMAACNSTKKTENANGQQANTPEVAITEQPAASAVDSVHTLSGYFLKNNYQFTNETDFLLLPDPPTFDSYLGVAKTMDNTIDKPDFAEQIVAAITMKPTNKRTDITISKIEKANNHTTNIYFEVKTGETLTYTLIPLLVFEFPKVAGIDTFNFITNGQTVQSLSLK